MSKKNKYSDVYKAFSLITQLGLSIVITIVIFTLIGKFLDSKFHTNPVLTIIFLILGVIGALRNAYMTLLAYTKRK